MILRAIFKLNTWNANAKKKINNLEIISRWWKNGSIKFTENLKRMKLLT